MKTRTSVLRQSKLGLIDVTMLLIRQTVQARAPLDGDC